MSGQDLNLDRLINRARNIIMYSKGGSEYERKRSALIILVMEGNSVEDSFLAVHAGYILFSNTSCG